MGSLATGEQAQEISSVNNRAKVFWFRPLRPLAPALLGWNGGLVWQLAQAAYDERLLPSGHLDPARLAILADALLDASCTDDVLLGHLREAGPHYWGCVGVDAVLGLE